jgi:hypothetical protein
MRRLQVCKNCQTSARSAVLALAPICSANQQQQQLESWVLDSLVDSSAVGLAGLHVTGYGPIANHRRVKAMTQHVKQQQIT